MTLRKEMMQQPNINPGPTTSLIVITRDSTSRTVQPNGVVSIVWRWKGRWALRVVKNKGDEGKGREATGLPFLCSAYTVVRSIHSLPHACLKSMRISFNPAINLFS